MPTPALRKAEVSDAPFLITAIKAAEGVSGAGSPTTYEKIFALSPARFDEALRNILSQDTNGHPLTPQAFFILEEGSKPIATCAAWVEAQDGVTSGFKVASLLCFELGMEKWIEAREKIKLV